MFYAEIGVGKRRCRNAFWGCLQEELQNIVHLVLIDQKFSPELCGNQRVKGIENPFTLKSFSPILGRRMEGKRKFMGEEWDFFYLTESRSVAKQILSHSGCLQVLPDSSGFYSNMAWTENVW